MKIRLTAEGKGTSWELHRLSKKEKDAVVRLSGVWGFNTEAVGLDDPQVKSIQPTTRFDAESQARKAANLIKDMVVRMDKDTWINL